MLVFMLPPPVPRVFSILLWPRLPLPSLLLHPLAFSFGFAPCSGQRPAAHTRYPLKMRVG
eukprot:9898279-Alexandrium_andersonii.AAC.1